MRAVIIEDEPDLIDQLKTKLNKWCKQIKMIGTANNADAGKELIQTLNPELVFLDIRMPNKDAFQMLEELRDKEYDFPFEIIFVSGHDQYGVTAIKWSALDFLIKPVLPEELIVAVNKAIEKKTKQKLNHTTAQLEHLFSLNNYSGVTGRKIALSVNYELRYENPDDIIRLESANNYTKFFLVNNEKFLVSNGLFTYEEMLTPFGFLRCHQSHLVNRKHIKRLNRKDGNELVLTNGELIPVARSFLAAVREAMLN
jgi:two-component system LytT family response regulator